MAEQINAGIQASGDSSGSSVLAVIPGPGFRGIFRDLEASACLEYGEQLPSCGEILEALEGMEGENIIVLPNDKNIIPAARLAQERSGKNVFVVPTANVVQGITALYGFNGEDSPQANIRSMRDGLDLAICLRVCRSDRDSRYGSVAISRGDAFVLHGEEVLAVDPCVVTALERALAGLDLGEAGCVSGYYGHGFDPSWAGELVPRIRRLHDALEVEFYDGGQTGTLLIVAVE
jgi:dihydroxyacetone kinase-like predicted kinase